MFTHVAVAIGAIIIMSLASAMDVTATDGAWWFVATPFAIAWGVAMASFIE